MPEALSHRWRATPPTVRAVLTVAVVAAAYAGAGWLSQQLLTEAVYVCALWPSAGVGLAAVLVFGRWAYLGVVVGSVSANWLFFTTRLTGWDAIAVSGLTALGALTETAILGWAVSVRVGREALLERFGPLVRFVVWVSVGCAASAAVGVTVGYGWDQVGPDRLQLAYFMWWSGDFLGILLVTPFVLALARSGPDAAPSPDDTWPYRIAYLVVFPAVVAASLALDDVINPGWPLALTVFGVLWACYFFPQRWALGIATAVGLVTVALTTHGRGPLAHPDVTLREGNQNLAVFVLGCVALIVSGSLRRRVRREVVERERQAAERVRQNLHNLFEESPLGIGWSDEHTGRFTRANPQLAELLGYPKETDLTAKGPVIDWLYVRPKDRDRLVRKLRRKGRASRRFEARRGDGGRMWLRLDARLAQRDGQPHILGFARDVTDGIRRRQCTKLLRRIAEALARYKSEGEWMPVCLEAMRKKLRARRVVVWRVADRGGRLVRRWENRGAADEFGLAFASPFRGSITDLCALVRSADPGEDVVPVLLTDGKSTFGVLAVHAPNWLFADQEGAPALNNVLQTAIQLMAEALAGNLAAKRNERIMKLAKVGIFYCNPEGQTIEANPEARRIQGMHPDDEREKAADWWRHMTDDCQLRVQNDWEQYVRNLQPILPEGQTDGEYYQDRQTFARPDGPPRAVEVRAVPVRAGRRVIGFVGVVYDVTEKIDLRLLRCVNATVNHDTRNAVSALQSVFRRLREIDGLPPQAADLIEAGEEKLRPINDLAQLALNPNAPQTDPEPLDVRQLLRVERTADQAEGPPTSPDLTGLPGDFPNWVTGYRPVITRVVNNLLANARPKAKSVVRLIARAEPVAGLEPEPGPEWELTLSVEDDGPGLTAEAADELRAQLGQPNDRIRQVIEDRTQKSLNGRGLLLCEFWLRQIGPARVGALQVETGRNGCNRFSFTTRVVRCAPPAAAPARAPDEPLPDRGPILIVEDHGYWRSVLAEKVSRWYTGTVVATRSGREAVATATGAHRAGRPFALVLMDIDLSDDPYDGVWAAREIRRAAPATRVVCISMSEKAGEEQLRAAGFEPNARPKNQIVRQSDLSGMLDGLTPPAPPPSQPGDGRALLARLAPGKGTAMCAQLALLHYLGQSPGAEQKFGQLYHQLRQSPAAVGEIGNRLTAAEGAGRLTAVQQLLMEAYAEIFNQLTFT